MKNKDKSKKIKGQKDKKQVKKTTKKETKTKINTDFKKPGFLETALISKLQGQDPYLAGQTNVLMQKAQDYDNSKRVINSEINGLWKELLDKEYKSSAKETELRNQMHDKEMRAAEMLNAQSRDIQNQFRKISKQAFQAQMLNYQMPQSGQNIYNQPSIENKPHKKSKQIGWKDVGDWEYVDETEPAPEQPEPEPKQPEEGQQQAGEAAPQEKKPKKEGTKHFPHMALLKKMREQYNIKKRTIAEQKLKQLIADKGGDEKVVESTISKLKSGKASKKDADKYLKTFS